MKYSEKADPGVGIFSSSKGDGIEPLNVTTLYEYTANEDEEREDGLIFYSVLTYQPRVHLIQMASV